MSEERPHWPTLRPAKASARASSAREKAQRSTGGCERGREPHPHERPRRPRADSTRGPDKNRVRTRRCCARRHSSSALRNSAPLQMRGAGRTPFRSAKSEAECVDCVLQLGEALLIGGAPLEAGEALAVGAAVGVLSGTDPSMSTQRKRSSSSITQVWPVEHEGMHSLRRHSPLFRSQAYPGEQFAQQPPVVERYTAVVPTVAAKPKAASA